MSSKGERESERERERVNGKGKGCEAIKEFKRRGGRDGWSFAPPVTPDSFFLLSTKRAEQWKMVTTNVWQVC